MNILEEIIANRTKQVQSLKSIKSFSDIKDEAEKAVAAKKQNRFYCAVNQNNLAIIAEVKKASPSKGLICKDFDYNQIAKEYDTGGAAAISVLTEESYFQGKIQYMQEIAETIHLPVLRKDFIIDEYQIYEAALYGASAILLIAAALNIQQISFFQEIANALKMDSLAEIHNQEELIKVLQADAQIIGINNRDLQNFNVSLETSFRLGEQIPQNILKVSESGIHSREDIVKLENAGFHAALIGETLMRQTNRVSYLEYLRGV